ncbi:hypothetical protein KRP22_001447 [Phytophthora ramorum]|nr:bZIP transcription factor 1 [Phytophthora ramorum]
MTSQFEISGTRFRRLDKARAQLSDNLVGLVRPRAQASDWHSPNQTRGLEITDVRDIKVSNLPRSVHSEATRAVLSLPEKQVMGDLRKRPRYDHLTSISTSTSRRARDAASANVDVMSSHSSQGFTEVQQMHSKIEIRREQCRTSQARYRNKQRLIQSQLESSVQQLRRELEGLKRQRQDVLLAEKTDQSPWTIVAEVFRIVESSLRSPWKLENEEDMRKDIETRRNLTFLNKAFSSNVAMGNLTGNDTLVDQWRRYSLTFGDSRLQLQRVESVSDGRITATARLQVTVTELVLRCMFPHLAEIEPQSKYDIHPTLRERLLGQHLDCSVLVDFLFDDDNGRVVRLEPRVDLMPELLRVLGDLKDVSEVYTSTPNDGSVVEKRFGYSAADSSN